jgi:hypothetical protein
MLQCGALDLDSEVKRAGQKVTVVRSGCGRAASDARSGTGRIVHAAPIALGPSGPSESPAGAAPPPSAAGLTRRWCKWLPFLLKNLFSKTNERVRQGATWRPGPRARLVDHERDRRSAATAASVRGHRGLGCRRRHGREPREGGGGPRTEPVAGPDHRHEPAAVDAALAITCVDAARPPVSERFGRATRARARALRRLPYQPLRYASRSRAGPPASPPPPHAAWETQDSLISRGLNGRPRGNRGGSEPAARAQRAGPRPQGR